MLILNEVTVMPLSSILSSDNTAYCVTTSNAHRIPPTLSAMGHAGLNICTGLCTRGGDQPRLREDLRANRNNPVKTQPGVVGTIVDFEKIAVPTI